jgi:DNA-binding transcriptional ArsR family regulator
MTNRRSSESLSRATGAFKALGHPARLRILGLLRPGGLCVCQVTAVLELAASTVSAHLGELKQAGLVQERKDGRFVSYSLTTEPSHRPLLDLAWEFIRRDPQVVADARLTRDLRRVPLDDLCKVELDVARLGLARTDAPRLN